MNKATWKKLQLGIVSLSAIGLLVACGGRPRNSADEKEVEESETD